MEEDILEVITNKKVKFDVPSKQPSHNINELYSIVDDGYTSEQELNTRSLIAEKSKKKQSGGFQSMGLTRKIFNGVLKKGYKVPTPIQRKCIPLIMQGKDVVAMARTGSGKTAAFLVPILEKLQARVSTIGARALLLSPTRELALQTNKFVKELGRFTDLRTACVLGGDKMDDQFSALHESPDILIATPGRLTHVLVEMEMKLKAVEYVVFDEADRLFELGFTEQLHEILRRLPVDRQTMLFSATLPKQLVDFAKAGLSDPTLVRLDVESKLSDQLKLAFFHVNNQDKLAALLYLLRQVCKPWEQTIIFVPTKHHVEYLVETLTQCDFTCSYSYSSLDQTARRMHIDKFRKKHTKLLVVTDVAARGLDIPILNNVINYSFPPKSKLFVHRVGRVARAGRVGSAYSLVTADELSYVIDLHLFLGRPLNFVQSSQECDKWDHYYGKASQTAIGEEQASMETILNKVNLSNLSRVSQNAYKQYIRCRPAASAESIKRAKVILKTVQIGVHPLFEKDMDEADQLRSELLDAVKNYKPNSTIFEIGVTKRSTGASVVRETRKKNEKAVTKYKSNLQEKRENVLEKLQRLASKETCSKDEPDIAQLQETFHTIVQSSSSTKEERKRKKKDQESFKDDEFYVDYKPKDFHSEEGLNVSGKNFTKEANSVSIDLMGDEDVELRRQKNTRKIWDRKRKKFVGADASGKGRGKKKIRTESGALISSTYKTKAYAEWKKKSKIDNRDDVPQVSDGVSRNWRTGFRSKLVGRPRGNSKTTAKVKSELKHPKVILKQRKVHEKNVMRQKGLRERKEKRRARKGKK